MFADSLLDSALISRSHRGWTTLISFFLEALMVGSLLMVPLLYTEGLPSLRLMRPEVIGPTPSRGPATKIEPSHSRNLMLKNASGLILMPPQQIPKGISPRDECSRRASAGAGNWRQHIRIRGFWHPQWNPKLDG